MVCTLSPAALVVGTLPPPLCTAFASEDKDDDVAWSSPIRGLLERLLFLERGGCPDEDPELLFTESRICRSALRANSNSLRSRSLSRFSSARVFMSSWILAPSLDFDSFCSFIVTICCSNAAMRCFARVIAKVDCVDDDDDGGSPFCSLSDIMDDSKFLSSEPAAAASNGAVDSPSFTSDMRDKISSCFSFAIVARSCKCSAICVRNAASVDSTSFWRSKAFSSSLDAVRANAITRLRSRTTIPNNTLTIACDDETVDIPELIACKLASFKSKSILEISPPREAWIGFRKRLLSWRIRCSLNDSCTPNDSISSATFALFSASPFCTKSSFCASSRMWSSHSKASFSADSSIFPTSTTFSSR